MSIILTFVMSSDLLSFDDMSIHLFGVTNTPTHNRRQTNNLNKQQASTMNFRPKDNQNIDVLRGLEDLDNLIKREKNKTQKPATCDSGAYFYLKAKEAEKKAEERAKAEAAKKAEQERAKAEAVKKAEQERAKKAEQERAKAEAAKKAEQERAKAEADRKAAQKRTKMDKKKEKEKRDIELERAYRNRPKEDWWKD